MKKIIKNVLLYTLALSLILPTVWFNTQHYTAIEDEPVDIYFIGSAHIDAAPVERVNVNGVMTPYYTYMNGSNKQLVAGTEEQSVKSNNKNWNTANLNYSIQIPKKVGKYGISGVESVTPLKLDEVSPITGKVITYEDIKEASYNASVTSITLTNFNKDGRSVIVINSYTSDGKGSNYVVNESPLSKDRFTYAASNYSITPAYNKDTYTLNLNINTNWETNSSLGSSGELWDTNKTLIQMADEAKRIVNIAMDTSNLPYPLPTDHVQAANQMYANPSIKAMELNGSEYESGYSKASNYNDWYSYWTGYITPGGLPDGSGGTLPVSETWKRLWNGTYFDTVNDDAGNVRVYTPYIIKLKTSNPLDLELVASDSKSLDSAGPCDAFYKDGFVFVKAVGNAVELPASQKGLKETVKLTIANETNPNINAYQGMITEQELKKGIPLDYFAKGSDIQTMATKLPTGPITKVGSYMRFPVQVLTENQTLKISLFINSNKEPIEGTWDNNPWETTVTIPGTAPDLIASKIIYTTNSAKIGEQAKINLNLLTEDKGFEELLSYVENNPTSQVVTKVWIDGTQTMRDTHLHPFLSKKFSSTKTVTTPRFTETKLSYDIKVELEINPNRNTPDKELTFDNNKIEREFTVYAEPENKLPEPEDPILPKFTNNGECVWIDKNDPNNDSQILVSLGTFTTEYPLSNTRAFPTGDIGWVKGNSAPQKLNAGKGSAVYSAVFPELGVSGWVKLSDDGSTGSCPHCKYDPAAYSKYIQHLNDYQSSASFVGWKISDFQQSQGATQTEVNNGTIMWLRMNSRQVSNSKVCESNSCCEADLSQSHLTYNSSELHGHHSHNHSYTAYGSHSDSCYETNPDGSQGSNICDSDHSYTATCTTNICEVAGNSCPTECHENSLCGTTYSNENPPHYHAHTEYRLEYASKVQLTYNIKLNNLNVKAVDYMTGDRITRAGYGISTTVSNLSLTTDYDATLVQATPEYGAFKVKRQAGEAYVRTPATNKEKPYLVSKLDVRTPSTPFDKQFYNKENPTSVQRSRLIFTDVDYKDTTQFPVIFAIRYPIAFEPAPAQYLPAGEKALLDKYPRLTPVLGLCKTDYITIEGNAWDDSWTHPYNTNTSY